MVTLQVCVRKFDENAAKKKILRETAFLGFDSFHVSSVFLDYVALLFLSPSLSPPLERLSKISSVEIQILGKFFSDDQNIVNTIMDCCV